MNLDIAGGQCLNTSVAQNLTFGYQGLPFGLSTGDGESAAPSSFGAQNARMALLLAGLVSAWFV